MFTIILPSYLGDYPNAATNRPEKLLRAVRSVINQTYKDWELIIISDGCDETTHLVIDFFIDYAPKIRLLKIKRTKAWAGRPRNEGIIAAQMPYCTYLDSDDYYLPEYLEQLSKSITDNPTYFVNEYRVVLNDMTLYEYKCQQGYLGRCGTSNIIHKSDCASRWTDSSYGHDDCTFLNSLMKEYGHFKELSICGYVNCHIPKKYDV